MNSQEKVIVGMSGGVDSSVAAYLLREQGYEVIGLFMKNWEGDDNEGYCPAAQDAADAAAVCQKLAIPFHTVNFAQDYWNNVFEYFLAEYQAGRTPNPDVMCNQEIKFKAFLDYAVTHLGADKIATGHYARRGEYEGCVQLLRGIDNNKDQSYFLYRLNQHQLQHALFPIGDYEKNEIRQIAKQQGFITHDKKDSTGICFIGERKFKTFLQEYLPAKPGNIETEQGVIVGQHQGLMYYTIGQRQGIQLGGTKTGNGDAWYVAGKDIKRNVLIIVQGKEHHRLFQNTLICEQLSWLVEQAPIFPLQCTAKIRYRQMDEPCEATMLDDQRLSVHFPTPQRAITPGQSIVFYREEICLGGGIIN